MKAPSGSLDALFELVRMAVPELLSTGALHHQESLRQRGETMIGYTARYVKTEHGYMGQLLEWPEVVTEGNGIEDCERSLEDATNQMVQAYKEMGKPIPVEHALFQTILIEA